MSRQNFMAIHPRVLEIFQTGPQSVSEWPTSHLRLDIQVCPKLPTLLFPFLALSWQLTTEEDWKRRCLDSESYQVSAAQQL